MRTVSVARALVAGALIAAAASAAEKSAADRAPALEKRFENGGFSALVRIEPGAVRPGETAHAVISASAPAGAAATLPAAAEFDDRFEGFDILGSYTDADGALHFSLSPVPGAERYRVRAFAVKTGVGAVEGSWFAAGPVSVPASSLPAAPGQVGVALEPVRIRPSARRVAAAALAAVACAVAVALAAFAVRRLRRAVKVRRLPPKRRALAELRRLLDRDLPSKGRFKDFYCELTLVVRRYIERRHGISAPRQTTEEFLSSVSGRPEFPADTVARLGDFLSAADMVKFAGVSATRASAQDAAAAARAYLDGEPD